MDKLLQIGSGVSTPLGLAGLATVVLLLIARAMLHKGVLATPSGRVSGQLLARIINYAFALALLAILFAGAGFIADHALSRVQVPRELGGTLRDDQGRLLKRTRVVLSGTNSEEFTNDLGWFRMPIPEAYKNYKAEDFVTLLVGDSDRPIAIKVPARTGFDVQLPSVMPTGKTTLTKSKTRQPLKSTERFTGIPPVANSPPVIAVQRVLAPETVDKLRPLSAQNIRIVYARSDNDLAQNAAERVRKYGAFVELQDRPVGDPGLNGSIVYQTEQANVAQAVRAALEEIAPLELRPTSVGHGRDIVVYLSERHAR